MFNSRRDTVVAENSVHYYGATSMLNKNLIKHIFENYGKIKKYWLQVRSGNGHGFVEYDNSYSARYAIYKENGKKYFGRKIKVLPFKPADSHDNKSWTGNENSSDFHSFKHLFVKNIYYDITTERELKLLFHHFGPIKRLRIHKKNSKPCGTADIKFANSESALKALNELNGYILPSGKVMKIDVYMNRNTIPDSNMIS
ncbi:polyadenylate-binding protein 2-like protein, partial [Leptotrombidium deliense]